MLTGGIRSQVDTIWNAFWSGGIANPLEVIEQITYLLFLRRLDDIHTAEELKANRLKRPVERRIYPEGKDDKSAPMRRSVGRASRTSKPARCLTRFPTTLSLGCAP